jgi:hypothetical protein
MASALKKRAGPLLAAEVVIRVLAVELLMWVPF